MDKVSDLVEVPPVQTVVRFHDLAGDDARRLVAGFLLTPETERALSAILGEMADHRPQGHFLTGNYGSGKSHFLAVLAALLEKPALRSYLPALDPLWTNIAGGRFLVVTVSLVEHAALAYLEDIVTAAVRAVLLAAGSNLSLPTPESFLGDVQDYLRETDPKLLAERQELFTGRNLAGVVQLARGLKLPLAYDVNRREVFAAFVAAWRDLGYAGLVVLLDELSEFLLSKPDSPSFNEDIRFLQFLGEAAPRLSAWIVAAVQEQVEETGAISAEILKKIKDRYPVRFSLSATHVRSLIEHRLVVKKPEAPAVIDRLYTGLAASFGRLPFTREEFCALYPVHPLTVTFLQGLSNLFSQHRGVVDFICHQLRGDPARNLPGSLDSPATTLLTADRIFDHFEDRFQANPELAPYYTTVYRYYRDEMPRLFPNGEDARTALAILKLLLLAAVYPYEKTLSLPDIAYHLLSGISGLDAQVNFEYLQDILSRLVREGAYVSSRPGRDEDGEVYFIDLEADVARVVRRELDYVEKGLFAGDERVFTTLGKWVNDPALPLADLLLNPEAEERVEWQNTIRLVRRALNDLSTLQPLHLEALLAGREADVLVFIGRPLRVEEQRDHLERVLLPYLKPAGRRACRVVFWLPRPFDPDESRFLATSLALALLLTKYGSDGTPQGRKAHACVSALQAERAPRVREIFHHAYTAGYQVLGNSDTVTGPVFGRFPEALRHLAGHALDRCHPEHYKIMPQTLSFPPTLPERFMNALLQDAADFPSGRLDSGLVTAFHYLAPMKVARKVGRGYRLDPDPDESPLLSAYLDVLDTRIVPPAEVARRLQESEFGLDRNSFLLLSQALLASGLVAAGKGGHRVNPLQLTSQSAFWQVEYLSRGQLVAPETWQAIVRSPLVPARLARESLTLGSQEKAWEVVREFKEKRSSSLSDLETGLREVERLPALAGLGENADPDVRTVQAVLKEIKISYPSRQGLESAAACLAVNPGLGPALDRLDNLERFLRDDLNPFLALYGYLHSPGLRLPEAFPELAERHAELLRLTDDRPGLSDPDRFRQVRERFARFKDLYRQEYLKEHQAVVGPQCFGAFDAIQSSAAYRLLERFGAVAGLTADHDLVGVKRMLARVFEKRCANDRVARDLEISPCCPCGFELGQAASGITPQAVAGAVDAGLREYLAACTEPHRYQKIVGYLAAMENAGRGTGAAPVRELLGLRPDDGDFLAHLERVFTHHTAEILNKALAGRARLVERNLDELYESLVDRSFAPGDLKRRFDEWLTAPGPLAEDDFIRVTGGRSHDQAYPPEEEEILKARLADFPELGPLYRRLGYSSFALVLTTVAWLASYDQPAGESAELTGLAVPEEDLVALEDMASRLFAQPSPAARTVALEAARFIGEKGLVARYLGRQEILVPEMIGRVTGERFFPFIFFPALRRLLAHLETGAPEKGLLATARGLARQSPDAFFPGREGMGAAARVAGALASLQSLAHQTPGDARGWERLYRDHLVPLGLNLSLALDQLAGLPLDPPFAPRRKLAEIGEALGSCGESFGRFPADGEKGASLAGLLQSRKKELVKKTFPARVYHILLDGLRLDLWEHLLAAFADGIPGGRVITHGLTWAVLPTTTASQFEGLAAAGLDWPRVAAADLVRDRELDDMGREDQIISFGFPDTKIHTSKDGLTILAQELAQAFEREVLPLIRRLPERSLCLFFADHGFRENPQFEPHDKYAAARYTHGGNSPWEVLCPWTAYFKIK
ncbi:MAG: DUF6079 family protein [Peptococcaceae bacterium]|jgi:hypothetical protein|nr:DUF6079 family protein [Peptococcaceae bacterium]